MTWDVGTSTIEEYEGQDIRIALSDSFWENLIAIDASAEAPTAANISIEESFNGNTIDFSSISGSSYQELLAPLNEYFGFHLVSDSPLYSAEFDRLQGSASFINENSGRTIDLQIADINNSDSWLPGSGLGAVDIDYGNSGNHIQTKIGFGFNPNNSGMPGHLLMESSKPMNSQPPLQASPLLMQKVELMASTQAQPNVGILQASMFGRIRVIAFLLVIYRLCLMNQFKIKTSTFTPQI